MNAPRVLSLIGDESGCTLWRIWSPFAHLEKLGFVADWDHKDNVDKVYPLVAAGRYDAVILPRMAWHDHVAGDRFINAIHAAGLAVVYEIDDDTFSPEIVQRQYTVHEKERQKGLEQLEIDRLDRIRVIQQCDGVTVTSKRLATVVRQYTDRPVQIVPNAIDMRWWRQVLRGTWRVVPPLTIGWCGGARYPEDLVEVAEAWRRIAQRYPEVRFVVQGHLADVLIQAVPAERIHTLPWLSLEEYPRAMLNVDIGCAAVANRHFNRCKTPIKIWEYTLSGAVVVGTPTLYGPFLRDYEDGLIAETAEDWEAALCHLVEDASLRRRLWRAQRRRVATEHSLEVNAWRWPAAWASILEDVRTRQIRRMLVGAA